VLFAQQPAAGLRLTPPMLDQFVRLRSVLVDQDSLLGPAASWRRSTSRSALSRELLSSASSQLQTESFEVGSLYAEFYGWLQCAGAREPA
jgi:hypothetical protein